MYFILGGAETMIAPLFPLVRQDLDLSESNLAAILAAVSAGIASFNVIGGATSRRLSDRSMVRATAVSLTAGMVLSAVADSFWVLLAGQTLLPDPAGCGLRDLLPARAGQRGPAVPRRAGQGHRGVAVSVLPVANAMLVAALPPQSGWGIGTFRAALLGSAALLSAIVSALLSLGIPLLTLMLAALGLPTLVAAAMHRAVDVPQR